MNEISQALRILRTGGLVAFPTETVYGLGADATNAAAVERIFQAKGRPSTNPIIVHVADERTARRYAANWPDTAAHLARKFWPGPLTLVLRKSAAIAPQVSAGRDTVGLRAPDHPLALELLRAFDGPIAAPSANRSTHVSPTTAEHVRQELGAGVDLILDGGPCRVGIESTVLDLSSGAAKILRPGSITCEQLEAEIGHVEVFEGSINPSLAAASPGQHAVHYAPCVQAFRFSAEEIVEVVGWLIHHDRSRAAVLLITPIPESRFSGASVKQMPASPNAYAHDLYAVLREADTPENHAILIEMPPDEPAWAAVRDRLIRATRAFAELG